MIRVENVSKSFGEAHVLKDISATFQRGKTNLIIGASGSGKSTLCKCIVGLHQINQGAVYYEDEEFTSLNRKEKAHIRKEIGFLFQGSALFDSQTVEENIAFPIKMFSNQGKKEIQMRVDECLERVNLKTANKLYPAELSGGMKKRVAIARAIAMRPKYLFCDEPNSGLDPQTSILIDRLIHSITVEDNITTIVITHDMNSVIEIGDYILFVHQGNKWWEGTKQHILETENKEVVDFVYASEFMKTLRRK